MMRTLYGGIAFTLSTGANSRSGQGGAALSALTAQGKRLVIMTIQPFA
jgi:hypothetical protein